MQQIADWLEKLGMSEYASALLKTALISRSFAN
jgi:SAM (Sterile alpha motif) domain-containing protein